MTELELIQANYAALRKDFERLQSRYDIFVAWAIARVQNKTPGDMRTLHSSISGMSEGPMKILATTLWTSGPVNDVDKVSMTSSSEAAPMPFYAPPAVGGDGLPPGVTLESLVNDMTSTTRPT